MKSLLTIRQEVADSRLSRKLHPSPPTDAEIFEQAGFYSAALGDLGNSDWQEIHQWCRQQFNRDHYTWTGSTFWFETEQAAVLFTLRWG